MIAAFSPFLALRYLLTRRINLLSVLGVMFAVWAILLVDSVFAGFVSTIRTDVQNSAPELLVTDLPHDTGYAKLRDALQAERELCAATAPRLRHHGMYEPLRRPPGAELSAISSQIDFDHTENGFGILVGIDPVREANISGLASWVARASEEFAVRGLELPRSRVLDSPDAKQRAKLLVAPELEWHARKRVGLPVESSVENHTSSWPGVLLGWRRFRRSQALLEGDALDVVVASFPGLGEGAALHTHPMRMAFAGWFATGHRMFDEASMLVPIETLRTLLGHDISDSDSIDLVTDIAVKLQPGLSAAARAAAKTRLQAVVQGLLPTGSAPCLVLDWEEQNEVFLSAVTHEQGMMQFVLFVVMLVAAFVIYATLHMMVTQKIKDIGILAALGGSPRGIGLVFLIGGLVVAVVGTALGIGTGVASAVWLNDANEWSFANWQVELFPRRLFDLREVPCHLEPSWIAKVGIGAIVLAVVVAFIPSRKAARMNPVTALAHE